MRVIYMVGFTVLGIYLAQQRPDVADQIWEYATWAYSEVRGLIQDLRA